MARTSAERTDCTTGSAACGAWRRFRQDHPYPYQAFAGRQLGAGKAVLVLSEPPPSLTREEAANLVKTVLADRAPTVQVARWMIGSDGYVEDIVATFDAPGLNRADLLSDPELRDRLALLQQAWFGTSCGGDVEVIGEGVGPRGAAAPNLQVSAAELISWMKDTKVLWTRVEDEAAVGYSWDEVASDPALVGAFVSADQSLALFTFDKSLLEDPAGFAKLRAAFRRFAVSSDSIVGAVSSEGGRIGLVGRGRTHALSEVPPLRFETFALLASQHGDELRQSYERTNPFAGKMDNLKDWAPIYLSPALIDGEFGALLNITDQMLKSWSEAGTVNYVDFNYPRKPDHFPFHAPLSDLVLAKTGSGETLFNWNTSGSAVTVHNGDLTVLTSRQLGALPVTYGSEMKAGGPMKTGHLLGFEDTGYDYFANLHDPNLARVVQYTLIYQALRNLGGSPASGETADPSLPQTQFLAARMKAVLTDLDAGRLHTRSRADSMGESDIATARTVLRDFRRQYASLSLDNLSLALVDRTSLSGLDLKFTTQGQVDQFEEDWSHLTHAITDAVGASQDLAEVRKGFERAATRTTNGWIHTPSLVVSWGANMRALLSTGGHNLTARALKIEASSEVQGVRLMDDGRIAYSDDQANAVQGHAAELARAVEHKSATQADIDRIMASGTPALRTRPIALARDEALERPAVARLGGRTLETSGQAADIVRTLKARNKCCRFMLEGEDGRIYMGEPNLKPPPTETVVAFGDSASVGPYLQRNPGRPPLDLIVLGQGREHVNALLAGWDMQAESGQGWAAFMGRMRGRLSRVSGIADHLVGADLRGRPGALSVADVRGDPAERTIRLQKLQAQLLSPGKAVELDHDTVLRMLEPLAWNVEHDGQPFAVRASFGGRSGGGDGLDVVAGFADRGRNGPRLQAIVDKDLADAAERKASLAAAMMTIENDLRQMPDAQFRRVAMHVRHGATETQTTLRAPRPTEPAFG